MDQMGRQQESCHLVCSQTLLACIPKTLHHQHSLHCLACLAFLRRRGRCQRVERRCHRSTREQLTASRASVQPRRSELPKLVDVTARRRERGARHVAFGPTIHASNNDTESATPASADHRRTRARSQIRTCTTERSQCLSRSPPLRRRAALATPAAEPPPSHSHPLHAAAPLAEDGHARARPHLRPSRRR